MKKMTFLLDVKSVPFTINLNELTRYCKRVSFVNEKLHESWLIVSRII